MNNASEPLIIIIFINYIFSPAHMQIFKKIYYLLRKKYMKYFIAYPKVGIADQLHYTS